MIPHDAFVENCVRNADGNEGDGMCNHPENVGCDCSVVMCPVIEAAYPTGCKTCPIGGVCSEKAGSGLCVSTWNSLHRY